LNRDYQLGISFQSTQESFCDEEPSLVGLISEGSKDQSLKKVLHFNTNTSCSWLQDLLAFLILAIIVMSLTYF